MRASAASTGLTVPWLGLGGIGGDDRLALLHPTARLALRLRLGAYQVGARTGPRAGTASPDRRGGPGGSTLRVRHEAVASSRIAARPRCGPTRSPQPKPPGSIGLDRTHAHRVAAAGRRRPRTRLHRRALSGLRRHSGLRPDGRRRPKPRGVGARRKRTEDPAVPPRCRRPAASIGSLTRKRQGQDRCAQSAAHRPRACAVARGIFRKYECNGDVIIRLKSS